MDFRPLANVIEDVLSRLVDRALLSRVQPPRSQHGRARLDGRARLGIRLARFLDRFRDAKKAIHRSNLCPLVKDPRSWRQAGDGELSHPLQVDRALSFKLRRF